MKRFLLFFLFLTFCNSNPPINVNNIDESFELVNSPGETTSELLDYITVENIHIYDQLYFTETGNGCAPYLGQFVVINCVNNYQFLKSLNFEKQIISIIKHRNNYYFLEKAGKLYLFNLQNESIELVVDFSKKVDNSLDRGAKGFAFSENENTFTISYVNELKQLQVDLYSYENEIVNHQFEKNLLSVQNEYEDISWHYGGHIIWSNNFNGYVVGVGDFLPAGPLSRTNENSLKSNSFIGKLILLNSSNTINSNYKVVKNNLEDSFNNILAIGLRNPWQFFETGSFFVVPDVGFSISEEINLVKMENFPINFGWPVFEGNLLSEEIDKLDDFKLFLNVFEENKKVNDIINFTKENSVPPVFTYNHNPAPNIYRGAIIGGDIFTSSKNLKDNVVFGDHISGEIFLYNINDGTVLISPFGLISGGMTNIKVFDEIENTLIVSTFSGDIHLISFTK